MLYKKNTLFDFIFKNIAMLQSVLTEEVRFKVVKIIFMMITPENSPRDLLMSSNQVKSWDVIEVQPLMRLDFTDLLPDAIL